MQAEVDKKELLDKIAEVKIDRADLEKRWRDMMVDMQKIRDRKTAITKQEGMVEAEIETLEAEEHAATTPEAEHAAEQKRWDKDAELRKLEEEEWDTADKETSTQQSLKDLEEKSQAVLHSEKELKTKLDELDALIQAGRMIGEVK